MDTETRTYLLEFLIDRFDMGDLRVLAFKLGVDYELFNYNSKSDFALELIRYHDRRESLGFLVEKMIAERHDPGLIIIYANLPSCNSVEKLIIASHTKTNRTRDEIARFFGLEPNEISIIAATKGSSRFLIGLPENVFLFLEKIQRKYLSEFSIQRFDTVDSFSQQVWHKAAFEWLPIEEHGKIFPSVSWAEIRKQTFLSTFKFESFVSDTNPHLPPVRIPEFHPEKGSALEEASTVAEGKSFISKRSPIPQHANQSDSLVWYEVADREELDSFLPTIQADTVLLVDTRTELYTFTDNDLIIVNSVDAEGSILLKPQQEFDFKSSRIFLPDVEGQFSFKRDPLTDDIQFTSEPVEAKGSIPHIPQQEAEKRPTRFYLAEVEEQFSFKRDRITGDVQFTAEEVSKVKINANQPDFPIFAEDIIGIVIGIWLKLNPLIKK